MNSEQWAIVRKRLYQSLPYIQLLLAGTVVSLSDEMWQAIIGLATVWLISPGMGILAAKNVPEYATPVDTEYARKLESRILHTPLADDYSNTQPIPCHQAHGSAEPHVLGCEGWSKGPV